MNILYEKRHILYKVLQRYRICKRRLAITLLCICIFCFIHICSCICICLVTGGTRWLFRGGYLCCILLHLFTLASVQRKSLAGKGETNVGSTGSMAGGIASRGSLMQTNKTYVVKTYAATPFQSSTLPNFEHGV